MKLFIATILCAALSAEACGRSPRVRYERCVSSGDPHYTPVLGRRERFTRMGEGEFKLVSLPEVTKGENVAGKFGVHACQQDVSKNSRTGSMKQRTITWNRDVVAWEGDTKVELESHTGTHGKVTITQGTTTIIEQTNVFKPGTTFSHGTNKDAVIVRKARRRSRMEIKFKSGRTLFVSWYSKKGGRFGTRKFFNVDIRIERNNQQTNKRWYGTADAKGLCYLTRAQSKTTTHAVNDNSEFTNNQCGNVVVNQGADTDMTKEIEEITKKCPKLVNKAFKQCGADAEACVFDIVEGCEKDADSPTEQQKEDEDVNNAEEEQKDLKEDAVPFTCPKNSFVKKGAVYPLSDFNDCDCIWGFEKKNIDPCPTGVQAGECGQTCVRQTDDRKDANTPTDPSEAPVRCFCDPNAPEHCMHTNDFSCGAPTISASGIDCTDPVNVMDPSKCMCSTGQMDCSKKSPYSIRELRAPGLAVPDQAFGQQPVFAIFSGDKVEQEELGETKLRISIANVQPKNCQCAGEKPCKHNNIADNTCFAKQELFGDLVCPAGTTECKKEEANVNLYRKDPNNRELELKDKQCRHVSKPEAGNGFCSQETPCKHINDGTCMPKQTWDRPLVDEKGNKDGPRPTSKCAVEDWRRATPSQVRGWFFETDSTCNMNADEPIGCADPNHRYAMDKWCDVNCNPKKYGRAGQKGFCPPSHCTDCAEGETPAVPTGGWMCPLDQYTDGSCFCSAGTELCGNIEVTVNKGVAVFNHLTIGLPGTYQLLVELVKKDERTGSTMSLTATSSVFEVRYPTQVGECRAQDQWRVDDLANSEVHGAGKAWFYHDTTVKCTSYDQTGTCNGATKRVYAMDKWCKANRCLPHTLENHCTTEATGEFTKETCDTNKFDLFGDCCDSGRVDQCGVCDGDGSTCELSYYTSTFADEVDELAVELAENATLANRHCPIFAPCAHIVDESCVPKTYASSTLVDEKFKYCPYDAPKNVAVWREGNWDDAAGKASSATLEKGNTDCFCPTGTVDLTRKAKIEEKMERDFKEEVQQKIQETKDRVEAKNGNTVTPQDLQEIKEARIVETTTTNKVEFFDSPCGGAKKDQAPAPGAGKIVIEDAHNHPLAAHAFKNDDGSFKKKFKTGDVKCIGLPGQCSVASFAQVAITKLTTVDLKTTSVVNFVNELSTKKYIAVETKQQQKVEQVRCGGNINKVRAQVIGTPLTAVEAECKFKLFPQLKDAALPFAELIKDAKQCVVQGGQIAECISRQSVRQLTADLKKQFAQFLTCVTRSKLVAQAQEKARAVQRAARTVQQKILSRVKSTGWYRRRLATSVVAAPPSGTQFVGRIATSGNTGLSAGASGTGASGTSFSSSANFGSASPGTAGARFNFGSAPPTGSSSAGLSAGMTALVALVSVGALALAAVGAKKYRENFTASKPQAASREMATTGAGAAKEDCTDVL